MSFAIQYSHKTTNLTRKQTILCQKPNKTEQQRNNEIKQNCSLVPAHTKQMKNV